MVTKHKSESSKSKVAFGSGGTLPLNSWSFHPCWGTWIRVTSSISQFVFHFLDVILTCLHFWPSPFSIQSYLLGEFERRDETQRELPPFHSLSLWGLLPTGIIPPVCFSMVFNYLRQALPSGKGGGFQRCPRLSRWVCLILWCSIWDTLLLTIEATLFHNNLKINKGDTLTPVHLTRRYYFSNGSEKHLSGERLL